MLETAIEIPQGIFMGMEGSWSAFGTTLDCSQIKAAIDFPSFDSPSFDTPTFDGGSVAVCGPTLNLAPSTIAPR